MPARTLARDLHSKEAMTLKQIGFAWNHRRALWNNRRALWKYRKLIYRRKEIAAAASLLSAAAILASVLLKRSARA